MLKRIFISALFFCWTGWVSASELWVDAQAAAGGTGTDVAPFQTIQDAIDAAAVGDTIWVKPGTYATGGRSTTGSKNSKAYTLSARVWIDKRLYIRSTGGREVTHIVGESGRGASEADGTQSRICVYVQKDRKAIVEGFTLRDGTAPTNLGGAGGIEGANDNGWSSNKFTLAYCTVSNCCGTTSGIHGGLAVGTLFTDNTGRTAYMAQLYNCVLANCSASYTIKNCGQVVNCTVVNNFTSDPVGTDQKNVGLEAGHFRNCVIYGNQGGFSSSYSILDNCLVDGTVYSNASTRVVSWARTTYPSNLCMSVVMGDFRPIKGGHLDGTGDLAYATPDFVPGEFLGRDFNGDTITLTETTTPLGAILTPVTPGSIGMFAKLGFYINGHRTANTSGLIVHYSVTGPAQVYLTPPPSHSNRTMTVSINKYGGYDMCDQYFLGWRKGAWITLPEYGACGADGQPLTGTLVYWQGANAFRYVDCNLTDYTNHDGTSWEQAFATLQEAVDSAVAANKSTRIFVKGGVYKEGAHANTAATVLARIAIPTNDYQIFFHAVDGPEHTFIEGAPDPDTLGDEKWPGIGPKAIRGAVIESSKSVAFSGFTFTNCYASAVGSSASVKSRGGAIYKSGELYTVDCRFVDCHASYGAAVYSGLHIRDIFEHCEGKYGVVDNGRSQACIFRYNYTKNTVYTPAYNSHSAYNAFVYEPEIAKDSVCNADTCSWVNGVIAAYGNGQFYTKSMADCRGNYFSPSAVNYVSYLTADQAHWENPQANINGVPLTTSPALGGGMYVVSGTSANSLCRCLTCDFDNNPLLGANGTFSSGAVVTPRAACAHYVKPDGDDAADGLTEQTAKRTLQAAVDDYNLCEGETVTALPGVYREGTGIHNWQTSSALHASNITIRARVHLRSGITLAARDGAEVTAIEGASATVNPDQWGRGKDAIRCAMIENGAVLRGFTVRNGRSLNSDANYFDDKYSGGILGRSAAAVAEDCIISNNVSACGGGSTSTTLRRCKILKNMARQFAGAVRHGAIYDCFIAGNCGPRATECMTACVNCTYGDNYATDGKSSTETFQNMGSCDLINTVVYGIVNTGSSANPLNCKRMYNCVFPKEMRENKWCANTNAINHAIPQAELAAMFDADGHLKARTNIFVDAGFAYETPGAYDLAGNARIANGAMDIGAYEWTWLEDYAAALGRNVTVTAAEQVVENTEGIVTLADGATLNATWSDKTGRNADHVISATLANGGTLKVYLNGELLGMLTATGSLRFRNNLAVNELTFVYAGTGSALLDPFQRIVGTSIIFR